MRTVSQREWGVTMRQTYNIMGFVLTLLCSGGPCAGQSRQPRPFNRIVILIDRSGSFQAKLPLAQEIAWKYVRNLANTSPDDQCYVIGVDRAPSEIAYVKGVRSRRDAQAEFEAAFTAVTDGRGTDWVTGLDKAIHLLSVPPEPGAKHLLVFGDLHVDDSKDAATGKLLKQFRPLAEFNWTQLEGVDGSFWFVAEEVRTQLLDLPDFRGLDLATYGIESEAEAKNLAAPRRLRVASTSSADQTGLGSLLPWVGGLVVLLILFVLSQRKTRGK